MAGVGYWVVWMDWKQWMFHISILELGKRIFLEDRSYRTQLMSDQ